MIRSNKPDDFVRTGCMNLQFCFYGWESGSQIGSWGPDSSKLLLMFSGKLSMSKILFVSSVRSSIRYNVTLWVKEKARLWVFTQPNVTVSQQSLQIAAKLSVRSPQGNLTNPRPKTFLFCHIFLSLWSSILRMSSIFLLFSKVGHISKFASSKILLYFLWTWSKSFDCHSPSLYDRHPFFYDLIVVSVFVTANVYPKLDSEGRIDRSYCSHSHRHRKEIRPNLPETSFKIQNLLSLAKINYMIFIPK